MERDNRRRLMLLQTLRTRDFDELAQAVPLWDLRFRQRGRGLPAAVRRAALLDVQRLADGQTV
jgi:hypothetical protein